MIKIDINAMLDTMSKGQIMAEIESQIDTAIAKKIEQETFAKHYNAAKSRVADDTYTLGDLDVLKRRLEMIEEEKEDRDEVPLLYCPTTLPAASIQGNKVVVSQPEEIEDILNSLRRSGFGGLFSK